MRYIYGAALLVIAILLAWMLFPAEQVSLHMQPSDGVLYDLDEVTVECRGNEFLIVLRVNPDAGVDLIGSGQHFIRKVDRLPVHRATGTTIYVAFSNPRPDVWTAQEFANLAPNHDRTNPEAWSKAFGVPVDLACYETQAKFRKNVQFDCLERASEIACLSNDRLALGRLSNAFADWELRTLAPRQLVAVATTHVAAGKTELAIDAISRIKSNDTEIACDAGLLFSIAKIQERKFEVAIKKLNEVLENVRLNSFPRSTEIENFATLNLCQSLTLCNRPSESISVCQDFIERHSSDLRLEEWSILIELLAALDDAGRSNESTQLASRYVNLGGSLPENVAHAVASVLIDAGWNSDVLASKGVSRTAMEAPKFVMPATTSVDQITTIANARAHTRLGRIATHWGKVRVAKEHLIPVLDFYQDVGYRGTGRADVEHELADLYLLDGDATNAILMAAEAVEHEEQGAFGMCGRLAESHAKLASAYYMDDDAVAAKNSLELAKEAAGKSESFRRNLTLAGCDSLASYLAEEAEERQQHLNSMIGHASREVEHLGHPRFMADEAKVWLGQYLAMAEGGDGEIYERISAFTARSGDAEQPWRREGAALIDVIHYHHLDDYFGILNGTSRMHYVAFLQLPSGDVRRVDLGESEPIDKAIRQWREAMSQRQSSDRFIGQLSELFWDPIVAELPGACRELFLCADWELGAAPWEAMPLADGSQLIDQCVIRRLPTSRSRRLLAAFQQAKATPIKELQDDVPEALLVGNLDYGRSRTVSSKLPVWSPLIGAAQELTAIRSLADAKVVSLEGRQATKRAVIEGLQQVEWAHFATHGFANVNWGRSPKQSILDSIDQGFGVTLSRANELGVDAAFTAADIARLKLPRLNLAVLSGCETGIGQPRRQLFLSTLHRAFHQAGATHVVASMWEVDDWATQALIRRFYEHYMGDLKGDPAAALRAAQLDIRDDPAKYLKPPSNAKGGRAPDFAGGPQPMTRTERPPNFRAPLWSWGAWYASSIEFTK